MVLIKFIFGKRMEEPKGYIYTLRQNKAKNESVIIN